MVSRDGHHRAWSGPLNRMARRRAESESRRAAASGGPPLRAAATAALAAGDEDRAASLYRACLGADPDDETALNDLGALTARRGSHGEAIALFERLLALNPGHAEAWLNLALSLGDEKRHADAAAAARKAIALAPRNPNAHAALGHVLGLTADLAGAAAACASALALVPDFAPAHMRRARILRQMGNTEESLASCDALIRSKPDDVTGYAERGLTLAAAGRRGEAEAMFREVLERQPGHAEALVGLCRSLLESHDADGAVAQLDRGLLHNPSVARLHMLRGLLNQKRGRMADAQADLRRAIEIDPSDATAYLNMGAFLSKTDRFIEAILFLEHAARLDPTLVDCYGQLAEVHRQLGHHSVAITLLEHGCELAPERTELRWLACWTRMHGCAWQDYQARIEDMKARALAAGDPLSPFLVIALGLPGPETLLWTRAWAESQMPTPAVPARRTIPAGALRKDGRIRVGYVSADFRGHAVAALVAELFHLHDRGGFEIFGYNIGRVDGSALGRDMASGLDHRVDLAFLDDHDAADRIAADEIAVLVDLNGFTTDSRPGIFAYRPAPIQVNYLGYPGSMGTTHIDYVIADPVVAPFALQDQFDEAIVHLPHSYQPNDRRRPGPDPEARRDEHGLPPSGFVFCCFNANFKLTPLVFGIWMRLLSQVPGSVLWLLGGNDLSELNLRSAAEAQGVAGARIVFAPRASYDRHLARLGLADLFLDTLPYNAHTTASEALWCGVPVLTCLGAQFAGRVAASLVTAVGLPELVTTSFEAYEALALALARDPARLGALRARLVADRDGAPLFDTPRYARNYEAALEHMVALCEAGEPPRPFALPERGGTARA